ncbi:Uncharacterised protein [Serratia odorifera]|uniref:Uncharacterized protein n=2 Tax=Serratia odorifera TaxID=618 RepID=D4DXQ3_SEROD|nr:hypothetical protein [Serratia odorifera]EFE97796.1 hypothetical protein HMPREF0758_0703 [Serratia odorifera DSM 4582]VDZ53206.1 Uncharacterised protein [Serratia odorifera]
MVDEDEKVIAISQGEISALKKLIMYVKFSCDDVESLQYAGSYAINSFFDKLIEADCFGEHEKKFYRKRNLDNESVIMNKIEKYQDESISKMSQDTLQEVFRECLHPFKSE